MPIYRFKCNDCGNEFIRMLKYGESADICYKCESRSLTRMISTGISSHYKGNGFTKAHRRVKKEKDKDG